jgi:hypothetical protein
MEAQYKKPTVISVRQLPSCASCFLQNESGQSCKYCTTRGHAAHLRKFKLCKNGHDRKIGKEKSNMLTTPQHSHHKAWCTKSLLAKSKKANAWECIPCFLKYGKHKPRKCMLGYSGNCTYCGVAGHHQGACGMRLFHAV